MRIYIQGVPKTNFNWQDLTDDSWGDFKQFFAKMFFHLLINYLFFIWKILSQSLKISIIRIVLNIWIIE